MADLLLFCALTPLYSWRVCFNVSAAAGSPSQDNEEALLVVPINPNNFPAKLWRIVGDPDLGSIRWDPAGEGIVIDQRRFEAELLSPRKREQHAQLFKTCNFTSFVRQLNLYGFRKAVLGRLASGEPPAPQSGVQHYFRNRHFKRDQPELLVHMKRLTSGNKAKMEAGQEVPSRPPSRQRRLLANPPDKPGAGTAGLTHRGFHGGNTSPYPRHLSVMPPVKGYDRTPVPLPNWPRAVGFHLGQGDVSQKGMPLSATPHFPNGGPSTGAPGQKYSDFIHPSGQYRPSFYSSAVCQCCSPGPAVTGCPDQNPPFSPYSYYQHPYPLEFLHPGNQSWQAGPVEEAKKTDICLDTVFQMANELQDSPKHPVVKVEIPVLDDAEDLSIRRIKVSELLSASQPSEDGDTEKTTSSSPPETSEIRSKQQNRSPNLNLLVDVACKQEPCLEIEEN
ncbi:heat shock factor protein 5 [Amia ocellicauda]|uniref:heat shock factor protein 5 n=1 Tax=Amia ocellicauda TaxID=2972642 RepID=UPI00346434F7